MVRKMVAFNRGGFLVEGGCGHGFLFFIWIFLNDWSFHFGLLFKCLFGKFIYLDEFMGKEGRED